MHAHIALQMINWLILNTIYASHMYVSSVLCRVRDVILYFLNNKEPV